MPVIEVTSLLEARRAKYAQYGNTHKAIMLNGQMVSGIIRSVMAVPPVNPKKWIVTLYPTPPRQTVEAPKAKVTKRR